MAIASIHREENTYCGFTNTKLTCKIGIVQVQPKFHECESKALEMGRFCYWTPMDYETYNLGQCNENSIATESSVEAIPFFIIL